MQTDYSRSVMRYAGGLLLGGLSRPVDDGDYDGGRIDFIVLAAICQPSFNESVVSWRIRRDLNPSSTALNLMTASMRSSAIGHYDVVMKK